MALIDMYNLMLGTSPDQEMFRNRVFGAMLTAAIAMRNEAAPPEGDALRDRWEQRQEWVRQTYLDPIGRRDDLLPSVLENVVLQVSGNNATDGDIQFVVNSICSLIGNTP